MSQRMEHLEPVLEELERYGLKGEVGERGKHLEIRWKTPNGERFITMARTPSDHRAALNSRSDLRKLLRADNLQIKPISEFTFQKAMSLPKPVTVTLEAQLKQDVDTLTDLFFEQQGVISELQSQLVALYDKITTARVVSHIQFGAGVLPQTIEEPIQMAAPTAPPFRVGSTSAVVYNALTFQYKTTHEIAEETGIGLKHVSVILWKAKVRGYVEKGLRGYWRRKP